MLCTHGHSAAGLSTNSHNKHTRGKAQLLMTWPFKHRDSNSSFTFALNLDSNSNFTFALNLAYFFILEFAVF